VLKRNYSFDQVQVKRRKKGQASASMVESDPIPIAEVGGPSQAIPFTPQNTNIDISSDQSDEDEDNEDLVRFTDIMDVADCAVDEFEKEPVASRFSDRLRFRKRKNQFFQMRAQRQNIAQEMNHSQL